MYCKKCGAPIKEEDRFCPQCGADLSENLVEADEIYREEAPKQRNLMALLGFIFSFFNNYVGLIMSIIGLKKAKKMNGDRKGLAIAGIIISSVSFVIGILFLIYSEDISAFITAWVEELLGSLN